MSHSRRRVVRSTVRVDVWAAPGNVVRMTGVMREPDVGSWLVPLIEEIHAGALEAKLDEVVLDIRTLEYANAALWRCLVLWLKRIRDASETYRLRLISNPVHRWQSVGVPALKVFGLDAQGTERLIVEGLRS